MVVVVGSSERNQEGGSMKEHHVIKSDKLLT